MSVDIKPFKVKAKKIKNPQTAEKLGIKHPFSMGIFGCSGSGKTVMCCNLFTNKQLFNRYFDKVFLFTPTGGADDTFKKLGLPKERIITDNMIENLENVIEEQKLEVERKGIDKAQKVCVVLEDLTSMKKFMNSKAFLQAFVQNRHLNISTIAVCHKFVALNRTARLQCNHCIVFPCNTSEQEAIQKEFGTPNFDKVQFKDMLAEAFRPEDGMVKPFLHINNKADIPERFRKSFKKVLKPEGFEFIFDEDMDAFVKKNNKNVA